MLKCFLASVKSLMTFYCNFSLVNSLSAINLLLFDTSYDIPVKVITFRQSGYLVVILSVALSVSNITHWKVFLLTGSVHLCIQLLVLPVEVYKNKKKEIQVFHKSCSETIIIC